MIKITIRNEKDKELQKVLNEVRQQMSTTIISYPERDPNGFTWGSPKYNGNCSAKVPLGFIDKLGAKSVSELFAGSGSLSDCCHDYQIPYCGIDLHSCRDNIIECDITNLLDELPRDFYSADLCFSHPPYPGLNHVRYAGKMYSDKSGYLKTRDIQNMDFETGMKMVNLSTMRAYAAMPKGSFLVLLVGEIRSKGKYYSMAQNLCLPGVHFQTYIKLQHNTWSDRQTYYGTEKPRAMTGHEMVIVLKKESGYEISYILPKEYKLDIRDSLNTCTWQDVIHSVMVELGGEAHLSQIYRELKGHKKAAANKNVEAKIRQTLQCGPYISDGKGNWKLVA